MTAERPDISIDAVYSQAEAARLLKVDRHTLRRWEKDPVFPLEGGFVDAAEDLLTVLDGRFLTAA